MKYEIIELEGISGQECTIYSVVLKGSAISLYRKFIDENRALFPEEIYDIQRKLYQMGHLTCAREMFFKHFEGKPEITYAPFSMCRGNICDCTSSDMG